MVEFAHQVLGQGLLQAVFALQVVFLKHRTIFKILHATNLYKIQGKVWPVCPGNPKISASDSHGLANDCIAYRAIEDGSPTDNGGLADSLTGIFTIDQSPTKSSRNMLNISHTLLDLPNMSVVVEVSLPVSCKKFCCMHGFSITFPFKCEFVQATFGLQKKRTTTKNGC